MFISRPPFADIVKIESIPISEITADEGNPNQMTKKQRDQLYQSIKRYGMVQPLVITHDRKIINGHQRYLVVKMHDDLTAKHPTMPCYVCPESMSKEDQALLTQALNKIHGEHSLVRDSQIFEKLLKSGRAADLEAIIGKKEQSILNIIGKGKTAAEPAKPTVSAPKAKLGDIYQLGRHIIVCGDNQLPETWAKLPKADIVFCSPPYNVGTTINHNAGRNSKDHISYDPHQKNSKSNIYNDRKTDVIQDYPQWLATLTKHALEMSKYLLINIQQTANNRIDWITYLYEHRNHFVDKIVWDKTSAIPLGIGILRNTHEDIIILSPEMKPQRKIDTLTEAGIDNIIRMTVSKATTVHNTDTHNATFPIDLPKWIIQHFCPAHGTVTDPCMGTGTTLMAAELTGRTAYGIEIEPIYVDYIISRWESHTKQKAEKVKSKES